MTYRNFHEAHKLFSVSHRGFYTAQPILTYLENLIKERAGRREPDFAELHRGLQPRTLDALKGYVKQNNGLRMRYKDPRTNKIRSFKISGLGGNAKDTM